MANMKTTLNTSEYYLWLKQHIKVLRMYALANKNKNFTRHIQSHFRAYFFNKKLFLQDLNWILSLFWCNAILQQLFLHVSLAK